MPDDVLQKVGPDLETLVTTAPVQRGQLLLRTMFGTKVSTVNGLVVPDGKMAITARVKEHHDAGADHVCIQVLREGRADVPLDEWRRLAPALV